MERQVFTITVNKDKTDDFGDALQDTFISTESFKIALTVESTAGNGYDITGSSSELFIKANDSQQTKISLATGVLVDAANGKVDFDVPKDTLTAVLAAFTQSKRLPTILIACDINTATELIHIRKLITVIDAGGTGSGSATPSISDFANYIDESSGDPTDRPAAANDKKAVAFGEAAVADRFGEMAYSSGKLSSPGDIKHSMFTAFKQTTTATIAEVFLDGSGERLTIPIDTVLGFRAFVVAREDTTEDAGFWQYNGAIKRNSAGTVSTIGTITETIWAEDTGAVPWSVTISSDNTNKSLKLQVTGEAAHIINWVIKVETIEVI